MDELLTGIRDAQTARYLITAAFTFQAYDYLTSLDEEIHLIWTGKVDIRHIHFFLNRYMPFATSVLSFYYVILSKHIDGCGPGFASLVYTTVIGMLIAELTVFLRVDAVWGRRLFVRILLGLCYVCSTAVILYFAARHVSKNSVLPLRFMSGCLYVHDDRTIWLALLLYTLCEFTALALLLAKTLIGFRLNRSPVMRNLYQDGIVYFIIITTSTVANLVLLLTASSTLSDAFLVPESILVNVLCSHMHLRIRKSHLESVYSPSNSFGIELRAPVFASADGSTSHVDTLGTSREAFHHD